MCVPSQAPANNTSVSAVATPPPSTETSNPAAWLSPTGPGGPGTSPEADNNKPLNEAQQAIYSKSLKVRGTPAGQLGMIATSKNYDFFIPPGVSMSNPLAWKVLGPSGSWPSESAPAAATKLTGADDGKAPAKK